MRRTLPVVLCLLPPLLPAQTVKPAAVIASSEQARYPASLAVDGSGQTFWVSFGTEPGQGPTPDHPESIDFLFTPAATLDTVIIQPRPHYGPARVEILSSPDGKNFDLLTAADGKPEGAIPVTFKPTSAAYFRLRFTAAHDPMQKARPRNVQVAEVQWKMAKATSSGGPP